MSVKELLKVENISKSFPGVIALNNITLDIREGEVVSLMGENGAGKSTLIKILAGVYSNDSGRIIFEGKEVEITSPVISHNLGISVIFQELNILPNLIIAENFFAGREKRTLGFLLDKKATRTEALRLLSEVGLTCDPDTIVGDLPLSKRQMVEIAKALSMDTQLIIMDEPTSSLTDKESEILFGIIDKLKQKGVSVVFVSHKVNEVRKISDRVHVLRDGDYIDCLEKEDITEDKIIELMVGRKLESIFDKLSVEVGEVVLEVKNLSTANLLKNISFQLRKGEILGFAGLVGAGRTELMRVLFGADNKLTGDIYIDGKKVKIHSPEDAIKLGIGFITEDRKKQGLLLGMQVKENVSIASPDLISNEFGIVKEIADIELSEKYVKKLRIKTPNIYQTVVNLSGGNQQKVVVAKWLATSPKVLIVDEPTRGIDIGSKKEIYAIMSRLAQNGVAIIMVSSELPEILGMSDRIIVMSDGKVKGELERSVATQQKIMELAIKVASA
jgi:ribose transport system ATP-binding protein